MARAMWRKDGPSAIHLSPKSRTLASRGLVLSVRAFSLRMSNRAPFPSIIATVAIAVVTTASCRWGSSPERAGNESIGSASASAHALPPDPRDECVRSIGEVLGRPALPGAPEFDRARADVLGRARGEPMVFVREPERVPVDDLPENLRQSGRLLVSGPPRSAGHAGRKASCA